MYAVKSILSCGNKKQNNDEVRLTLVFAVRECFSFQGKVKKNNTGASSAISGTVLSLC